MMGGGEPGVGGGAGVGGFGVSVNGLGVGNGIRVGRGKQPTRTGVVET